MSRAETDKLVPHSSFAKPTEGCLVNSAAHNMQDVAWQTAGEER